jgi:hypothetical protein
MSAAQLREESEGVHMAVGELVALEPPDLSRRSRSWSTSKADRIRRS